MHCLSKTEMAYFKAAKAISTLSDHKQKIGCVVVNQHRIVSSASNSNTKCHKVQAILDKKRYGCECPGKVHSEVAALIPLINSGVDLSRASIFVYRQHKNGTIALARPCPSCYELIKSCGIRKMYFTTESGYKMERL